MEEPTLTINGNPLDEPSPPAVELTSLTLALTDAEATVPTSDTADTTGAPTLAPNTGADATGATYGLYEDQNGTTPFSKDGVSVDADTGVVSVTKAAAAALNDNANECYLVAKKGSITSNGVKITINKTPAEAAGVTLNPTSATATLKAATGGADDIAVAVTAVDQYGSTMTNPSVSISGQPTGVTYENGNLKIGTNAAATTGAQNITFTVGSQTATFALTISKGAGAAVTGVTGVSPTTPGGADGYLNGTTTAMEYVAVNGSETSAPSSGWADCSDTRTTLAVGSYWVRAKETDYTAAGEAVKVTIADKGVSPAPVITKQPEAVTAYVGDKIELKVTATGDSLTYQWQKKGATDADFADISGATNAAYTIASATAADNDVQYQCVVTNTKGADQPATATTTPVTVTVQEFETLTFTAKNATGVSTSSVKISDLFDVAGFAAGETLAGTIGDKLTNNSGTWTDAKGVLEVVFYEKTEAKDAVTGEDGSVITPAVPASYDKVTNVEANKTYFVTYKVNAVTTGIGHNQTAADSTKAAAPANEADEANYTTVTFKKKSSGGNSGGSVSSTCTVRYDAGTNGTLDGKASESVTKGGCPKNVPTVKAKDGYRFAGWSLDGKTVDPTKTAINKNVTFTAVYTAEGKTVDSYIKGYQDGTVHPDAAITRAEVATILARLSKGFEQNGSYTGSASDVSGSAWYAASVSYGIEKGVITGYPDGTFRPGGNITRAEFAALMARFLKVEADGSASFNDISGSWAKEYIAALEKNGIVNGYGDGGYHPNANLTRAEAIKMINMALGLKAEAGDVYVTRPSDLSASHWAYDYIMKALSTDILTLQR